MGTEVRVELDGEIDIDVSPALRARLSAAVADAGAGTVVVDASKVTFLDSSGLSALIAALKQARAQGGRLLVVDPSTAVRRTLEITGVLGQFGLDGP